MIICTVTCADYLYKALVLAKSSKEQMPDVKIALCLLEKEVPESLHKYGLIDHIFLAKDIGIPNFEAFISKYSNYEASTAIKGYFFTYLLNHFYEENNFIFLDPDIYVLQPFNEVKDALDTHPIILTPQVNSPMKSIETIDDIELTHLTYGVFNMGFFAFRRDGESTKFINWYTDRLDYACYNDVEYGVFVDQKWVNLAPAFFNLYILKHKGYNVAQWNLPEREITKDDTGSYIVDNVPLVFYHFSGLGTHAEEREKKYIKSGNNAFFELKHEYINLLNMMGKSEFENIPWSYDSPIKLGRNLFYRRVINEVFNSQRTDHTSIQELNSLSSLYKHIAIIGPTNSCKMLKRSLLHKNNNLKIKIIPQNNHYLTSAKEILEKRHVDLLIFVNTNNEYSITEYFNYYNKNLINSITFINI
ncbi:hypothetical protein BC6307_04790 [Sutcliffiella cohnii]|uniref:Glycosyl transferase n=2 Tax=Bacillaceae TaxID=186817 RepID=A0A223KMC3_9BACI|nr:hypothetical protein [Sutcliffiella cohnii]AST90645.1 hypothetical protein BC6307_04790 [Sutcliffiella cohnii]